MKADTKKCCEIAIQPPFDLVECSALFFSMFSKLSFWYLSSGVHRVGPVKLGVNQESPGGLLPSCWSCR